MNRYYRWFEIACTILMIIAVIVAVMSLSGCGEARNVIDHAKRSSHGSGSIGGTINWLVTISILGIGACVAAAIFLPVKGLACAGAGGFATVLGLALIIPAIQPFLPWVALGIIVLAFAAGIWYFRKYVLATHCAVDFGTDMSRANTEAEAEVVKAMHATKQLQMGVKNLIDQTIAKVK